MEDRHQGQVEILNVLKAELLVVNYFTFSGARKKVVTVADGKMHTCPGSYCLLESSCRNVERPNWLIKERERERSSYVEERSAADSQRQDSLEDKVRKTKSF
jgi:hypothetical protein